MRSSTSSLRSCACAQVVRHVVGVVEIGDRRREMVLTRQQDVLGAAGQVSLVLLGQRRDGKGVPAEGVGIARSRFSACRRRSRSKPDEAAKQSAPSSTVGRRTARSAFANDASAQSRSPTGRYSRFSEDTSRQQLSLCVFMLPHLRKLMWLGQPCVALRLHLCLQDCLTGLHRCDLRIQRSLALPRRLHRLQSKDNIAMSPLMNSSDPKIAE